MSLTTPEEIKRMVQDEKEQLESSPYPEDLLREFADSECPIYYGEIVTEWQELAWDDTDRWQEIGAGPDSTIHNLMQIDLVMYYERLFVEAWEEVKGEKELTDA